MTLKHVHDLIYYLLHAQIISERKELKYEANVSGGTVTFNSLTFYTCDFICLIVAYL